ncbi:hypothetical protein BKA70DRAFT_1337257 [Coprinopsis sp. MPI-PUGE-AT-0042]|nr:hypothetical protein BKA70DRAFT_1337257 [Coprinopsis sp. MPI-PUGE-AT-0042]
MRGVQRRRHPTPESVVASIRCLMPRHPLSCRPRCRSGGNGLLRILSCSFVALLALQRIGLHSHQCLRRLRKPRLPPYGRCRCRARMSTPVREARSGCKRPRLLQVYDFKQCTGYRLKVHGSVRISDERLRGPLRALLKKSSNRTCVGGIKPSIESSLKIVALQSVRKGIKYAIVRHSYDEISNNLRASSTVHLPCSTSKIVEHD